MDKSEPVSYDDFKNQEYSYLIVANSEPGMGTKRIVMHVKHDIIRYHIHTRSGGGLESMIILPIGTVLKQALEQYNKTTVVQ